MVDLLILLVGALLVVRGWRRGLIRQLASLIPFLLGLVVAVRLTPDWASLIEDWLGIPYGAALVLVGVCLLGVVAVGGAVLLRALSRVARLPGFNTVDRLAGALLGLVWLVVVVMAAVWFASFLSLPSGVTAALSESSAVGSIAGPSRIPRRILDALTGDNWPALLVHLGSLSDSVDNLLRDLLSGEITTGQV